ncbi:MAG: type IV secretion system DNA-binding domain-containing protein [Armatimonadetes bacterium]|nr:type IV secretion system DNA-binding domain-containing protein [Armatimonadota bacterium]
MPNPFRRVYSRLGDGLWQPVVGVAAWVGVPFGVYLLLQPLCRAYYRSLDARALPTWAAIWWVVLGLVYVRRLAFTRVVADTTESWPVALRRLGGLLLVSALAPALALGLHLVVGLKTYSLLWANLAAAGGSLLVLWYGMGVCLPKPDASRHIRGRRILNLEEARAKAGRHTGLPWGGVPVRPEEATTHFMVVGAPGSGKTVTIRALLKAVLPELGQPGCRGALIFDPKRDVVSALAGLGLTVESGRVFLLNPFDARCAAWDLAADVTQNDAALEVATILCPREERSSSPYFADAARDLVEQVIRTFIRLAPGQWTLRDVLVAADNEADLVRVLRQTPRGVDLLAQHAGAPATWANVRGSLSTKLRPYHVIGALWHRATRRVSLEAWFAGGSVLVLGSSERSGEALRAINRVLFRRLTQIALDQREDADNRRWFFIDEAKEAGHLEGLGALLSKGRSKGMCVVLGFQDTEGMQEVYGDHAAMSLMGQPNHRALLRMGSPQSAAWVVQQLGKVDGIERRSTRDEGTWFGRTSTTEQREERDALLTSQVMELHAPDATYGPDGVYLTEQVGAYRSRLRWQELDLPVPDANVEDYQANTDPAAQELAPWTQEDLERLGLAPRATGAPRLPDVTTSPPSCDPGGNDPPRPSSAGALDGVTHDLLR